MLEGRGLRPIGRRQAGNQCGSLTYPASYRLAGATGVSDNSLICDAVSFLTKPVMVGVGDIYVDWRADAGHIGRSEGLSYKAPRVSFLPILFPADRRLVIPTSASSEPT
jgi:hypothetical protein